MHVCYACQRTFKSKQSLFGHLKHCKKHAEAKAQNKAQGYSFGQQHPGPPGATPNQASNHRQTESPMDWFKTFLENCSQSSGADPLPSPEERRRLRLQEAKRQTIDSYFSPNGTVTPAMRGKARKALESELGPEPLEKFPWTEILERAIAVREAVFEPYFQREREEHDRIDAQKRECLEQAIRDQRLAEQKKSRKALWLELVRPKIAAGCERRGLPAGARISVALLIEQQMEVTLTGEESEPEAQGSIQFILDQHFQIIDEQNAARLAGKRRQLAGELVDAAVALAPLGLALATPYLKKGVTWVEEKLKQSSTPTPEAPSQDTPTPNEDTGQSQPPLNTQAETDSPSSIASSTTDSDHDHAPPSLKSILNRLSHDE